MSLPVNARIQAAESFVRNVRSAQEFLHQQDSTGAETRYGALLVRLKEAREHLRWNPAAGRPARFLKTHSAQGQTMAGFSTRAQIFVDEGFVFAEPNVRGSDGYGKSWIHADDGAKRLAVLTDIEDASKFVREKWAANGKAPKVANGLETDEGHSSRPGCTENI